MVLVAVNLWDIRCVWSVNALEYLWNQTAFIHRWNDVHVVHRVVPRVQVPLSTGLLVFLNEVLEEDGGLSDALLWITAR